MAALPWNAATWSQIAQQRFGITPPPAKPAAGGPTPYVQPTSPPPGTYDPSLDFQGENTNLGYQFAAQDDQTARARTGEDYSTALAKAIQAHADNTNALTTGLGRANADYATSTQALGRQYQNLAARQSEALYGGGTNLGGAAIQSQQKRTANQALDQGKLDQAVQRFRADNATRVTAENQSWRDLAGVAGQGTTLDQVLSSPDQYGSLGQRAARTVQNADTGYARSGLENILFGDQLNRAKTYSAQQAGLLPTRPDGTYATLAPGETSQVFGGVEYGATPGSPFLSPVAGATPSAESVLATGSLLGTNIARRPPASYYRAGR